MVFVIHNSLTPSEGIRAAETSEVFAQSLRTSLELRYCLLCRRVMMAATPPGQITPDLEVPPTPLHGPMYDDESPRTRSSARLRQKRSLEPSLSTTNNSSEVRLNKTPRSPRRSGFQPYAEPHSPGLTPKRTSGRRVQIYSPSSPDSNFHDTQLFKRQANDSRNLLSSATMTAEGSLPTPVKTPKKKPVSKTSAAARALFQEPQTIEELVASPRKSRKNKRFNGFSLESFRAEDTTGQIQIFTDSRDQIPESDSTKDNPFKQEIEHSASSRKVPGTVKRRKVSEPRPTDPQVEEAIREDNGMVYVL